MSTKSYSLAQVVEDYLIQNIWNNRYPAGSTLPSEQELSARIGVTRTTLREVLQRLACDGWINIRHGKPTVVNNIWETSGLKLLDTIASIEKESLPQLIDNLLSVRKNLAASFICHAFKRAPEQADQLLSNIDAIEPLPKNFAEFDFNLFRELAFASGNSIYGLMINGLRGLYLRFGLDLFANEESRKTALDFYRKIRELGKTGEYSKIARCVNHYGESIQKHWNEIKKMMR